MFVLKLVYSLDLRGGAPSATVQMGDTVNEVTMLIFVCMILTQSGVLVFLLKLNLGCGDGGHTLHIYQDALV